MANYEAFHQVILSSINLFFLKSGPQWLKSSSFESFPNGAAPKMPSTHIYDFALFSSFSALCSKLSSPTTIKMNIHANILLPRKGSPYGGDFFFGDLIMGRAWARACLSLIIIAPHINIQLQKKANLALSIERVASCIVLGHSTRRRRDPLLCVR